MFPLLLTLIGLGCSSDDSRTDKPVDVPVKVEEKPKSDLELARAALATGDAAAALAKAEAWVAAHPEDDAGWDLVELSAHRAGAAAALVDRLSADQAIGGRADRHHALRGSLALVANRPADALVAARALATVAPGDAAALVAGAVALGAPAPEVLDPGTKALVAAMGDAKGALDPAVDALPGWRVALVRAELRLARGDNAGASAELGKLPGGWARLLGLPLALRAAPDATTAWASAEATARDALTNGDVLGAVDALDLGMPFALVAWDPSRVATVAGELRKTLETDKNTEGAAALAAVQAHAELRAGHPSAARASATVAAAGTAAKARGSWELALSCAAVGDAGCVDGTVAALAEPRATAARELAAAMRGAAKVPGTGLPEDEAALVGLLSAGWVDDPTAAWEQALAARAPDLKTWGATWADRSQLRGEGGATWASEAAARAWLASGAAGTLGTEHPDAASWNAVMKSEAGAPGAGLTAWARARQALGAGDVTTAAKEYATLAQALPAWRSGPWTPVLVLDGAFPGEMAADAELVRAAADPVTPAVELHGWSHRRDSAEMMWRSGVTAVPRAATPEQSAAVWDAAAAYRFESLKWLAIGGAFPSAARDALAAAEKGAGLSSAPSPGVTGLRAGLDSSAVISFRRLPGMVEVLYLTPNGGKLVKLKPQTADAMQTWTKAISAGDSAVASGDRLRTAVLDSSQDILTGLGKYLVVGPAPFGAFAIDALPEQADGLRFLADIRSVSRYQDFDAILASPPPIADEFQQTLVALCATPGEADTIRRTFPQAMVLEGPEAKVAAWKASAGNARFLHIGDFPAGPSGGWQLADGELTLGDLAATPLMARLAYLGGVAEVGHLQARMVAARRAGLHDFLVGAPALDPNFHDRTVLHFWEGGNRRYNASRSFYEARATTLREFDASNRPVNWVRYLVAGKP